MLYFEEDMYVDEDEAIQGKTQFHRSLQRTYQYMAYTIIDYGGGRYAFVLNDLDARENSDLQFSF